MKVQATSWTQTVVSGLVTEEELMELLVNAGLHIPPGAGVRFWVANDHADANVGPHEPLRFSISWKTDPLTTPPASVDDESPT